MIFALLLQLPPFRTSGQPLRHIAGTPPPSPLLFLQREEFSFFFLRRLASNFIARANSEFSSSFREISRELSQAGGVGVRVRVRVWVYIFCDDDGNDDGGGDDDDG